jgi:hypothetical protein
MARFFRQHKQANTFLEYVAVFCIVVGVFVAMGRYVQQGMQGNARKAGEIFGYGRQ